MIMANDALRKLSNHAIYKDYRYISTCAYPRNNTNSYICKSISILMLLMSLRIDKLVTNETRKTLVPKEYLIYNKITEFGI